MTSENYRQLLNAERNSLEMTKEDFDNTLMHFAMLYHKEQLKLYGVVNRRELLCDDCNKQSKYIAVLCKECYLKDSEL